MQTQHKECEHFDGVVMPADMGLLMQDNVMPLIIGKHCRNVYFGSEKPNHKRRFEIVGLV